MQVERTETLLRARYYHSQMDMELLLKGQEYDSLPETYVIFICDYDPLGGKRYRYTLEQVCIEDPSVKADAGAHTIFLSTKGENDDEVSEPLRKFLRFVGSELETSEEDFGDAYIQQLQKTVRRVKRDREMGVQYMLFQELLNKREAEGRAEGELRKEIALIIKKMKRGKDLEQIADELELETNRLKTYMEVIVKYAPDYDEDAIVHELMIRLEAE